MKAVMPVRRALGVRTVFNLLGPLTNPAGGRAQVMGVHSAHLVPIVAETMRLLGVRHAFVVHGDAPRLDSGFANGKVCGMDELSISGPSQIAEVRGSEIAFHQLTPRHVSFASAPIESLRGGDAQTNAAILREIFAGERGPQRDVVLLNAAAVLITAGLVPAAPELAEALRHGIELAANTIDSGAVTALIAALGSGHP
jgi:anthranilate phosphoribosyltransferase